MKTIAVSAILILCSAAAWAQDAVTDFAAKVGESRVSFGYSYVAQKDGSAAVNGSGTVKLQGTSYIMEGDGLKVISDGRERWSVDEAAKEVVVETVMPGDALMSPITVISRLPELFIWQQAGKKTLFRKMASADNPGVEVAATKYTLTPKDNTDSDIEEAFLFFDSASSLIGADIKMKGGLSISFNIYSVIFSEPENLSFLALTETSFDSSYIITDLR